MIFLQNRHNCRSCVGFYIMNEGIIDAMQNCEQKSMTNQTIKRELITFSPKTLPFPSFLLTGFHSLPMFSIIKRVFGYQKQKHTLFTEIKFELQTLNNCLFFI